METLEYQEVFMDSKVSPLQFLRHQSKIHKGYLEKEKRRMKRKAHLADHIQHNNNIFHLAPQQLNRRTAQNIIWEKNYMFKNSINTLKEENNTLKAHLWNVQKQNRKMDKQIQAWGLEHIFKNSRKKPYIDLATASKVLSDQDYEIVTNKIEIGHLEKALLQIEDLKDDFQKKNKERTKKLSHYSFLLGKQKTLFLEKLRNQMAQVGISDFQTFPAKLQILNQHLYKVGNELELVKRKIELKKKANEAHSSELQVFARQRDSFGNISEEQVIRMKQLMRKTKLEEQQNVKDMKKECKEARKAVYAQEYENQDLMGVYIQEKVQLCNAIDDIELKIKELAEEYNKNSLMHNE